ncbi:MAG: hypothetical protein ACO2YR_07055 [Nitrosopumilaceae archaeon]
MIVDLNEKNKVMIPKITKIQQEGFAVKSFDLSKFEKTRKIRFSDSKEFS